MTESNVKQKFVAAWSEADNPPLDCVNPHFKNKYASLKATLAEVRRACKPHGIAYVQKLCEDEAGSYLASFVTDGADCMELSTFRVATPPNPQAFGSELTYKKRQQAQADWGIVGEVDEDGEIAAKSAESASKKPKGRQTARQQAPEPANKLDGNAHHTLAKARLWTAISAYAKRNGVDPNAEIEELGGKDLIGSKDAAWLNAKSEYYENN